MKITIVSVGNLKEKYLIDGIKEYIKRLAKYATVEEIVVQDEPIMDKASEANMQIIKAKEGKKILQAIKEKSYLIALDLKGAMLSSEELADKIKNIQTYNSSHICFIIGGSLGLSEEVLNSVDYRLCFSKMTFPHQLMKLILAEQIYRAFKINCNEVYHK